MRWRRCRRNTRRTPRPRSSTPWRWRLPRSPTDKTYANQLKAGAILDRLFAAQPDHPGLAHYIIHSYDLPPLADRGLEAARRYARIAPAAPHALHMPSHTFTRVGYWQESVDANIAVGEAARAERATGEELHASDYQVYAYLQMGHDRAAAQLATSLPEMASRFDPQNVSAGAPPAAGFFALAAIPARYALERGAWAEAVEAGAVQGTAGLGRCDDLVRPRARRRPKQ